MPAFPDGARACPSATSACVRSRAGTCRACPARPLCPFPSPQRLPPISAPSPSLPLPPWTSARSASSSSTRHSRARRATCRTRRRGRCQSRSPSSARPTPRCVRALQPRCPPCYPVSDARLADLARPEAAVDTRERQRWEVARRMGLLPELAELTTALPSRPHAPTRSPVFRPTRNPSPCSPAHPERRRRHLGRGPRHALCARGPAPDRGGGLRRPRHVVRVRFSRAAASLSRFPSSLLAADADDPVRYLAFGVPFSFVRRPFSPGAARRFRTFALTPPTLPPSSWRSPLAARSTPVLGLPTAGRRPPADAARDDAPTPVDAPALDRDVVPRPAADAPDAVPDPVLGRRHHLPRRVAHHQALYVGASRRPALFSACALHLRGRTDADPGSSSLRTRGATHRSAQTPTRRSRASRPAASSTASSTTASRTTGTPCAPRCSPRARPCAPSAPSAAGRSWPSASSAPTCATRPPLRQLPLPSLTRSTLSSTGRRSPSRSPGTSTSASLVSRHPPFQSPARLAQTARAEPPAERLALPGRHPDPRQDDPLVGVHGRLCARPQVSRRRALSAHSLLTSAITHRRSLAP